jgi:hypothetical protein
MITSLFCNEYKSALDSVWDSTQSNRTIIMVDPLSGLSPSQNIEAFPLAQFSALFHGNFDSPEMEARKDGIIREFRTGPLSKTKRLMAFIFLWDADRRIHFLVETVRETGNRDGASSYAINQCVVSVE